jgi:hypothetical protein
MPLHREQTKVVDGGNPSEATWYGRQQFVSPIFVVKESQVR